MKQEHDDDCATQIGFNGENSDITTHPCTCKKETMKTIIEARLRVKDMTMNQLSEVTGIAVTTLWRRLNDPDQFTICEVKRLADALGLKMKTLIER